MLGNVFERIRLDELIPGIARLLAVVDARHMEARHLIATGRTAGAAEQIK
jgi:hypothetical protein